MAVYGSSAKINVLESSLLEYEKFFLNYSFSFNESVITEGAIGDKVKFIFGKIKEYFKKFVAWIKEKVKTVFGAKKVQPEPKSQEASKAITDEITVKLKYFPGDIVAVEKMIRILLEEAETVFDVNNDDDIEKIIDDFVETKDSTELDNISSKLKEIKAKIAEKNSGITIEEKEVKGKYDSIYNEYKKVDEICTKAIPLFEDTLKNVQDKIPVIDGYIKESEKNLSDKEKVDEMTKLIGAEIFQKVTNFMMSSITDYLNILTSISNISTIMIANCKKAQAANKAIIAGLKNKANKSAEGNK